MASAKEKADPGTVNSLANLLAGLNTGDIQNLEHNTGPDYSPVNSKVI